MVKAGQVLAFEVLHYLVTKPPFPGLSEEAHTPPQNRPLPEKLARLGARRLAATQGVRGFAKEKKHFYEPFYGPSETTTFLVSFQVEGIQKVTKLHFYIHQQKIPKYSNK